MPLCRRMGASVLRKPIQHCLAFVMLVLAQGLFAVSANAHPHAWIDLRSTVVLNEAGQAVALEQEWLFDDFYTAVASQATGSTDWTMPPMAMLVRSRQF